MEVEGWFREPVAQTTPPHVMNLISGHGNYEATRAKSSITTSPLVGKRGRIIRSNPSNNPTQTHSTMRAGLGSTTLLPLVIGGLESSRLPNHQSPPSWFTECALAGDITLIQTCDSMLAHPTAVALTRAS
ncbi:predicted protein [Histoplasma capsulatum var. duboisii H88]|uniref:Predicted protein n=2 Tax=Ajellomyces capsulatus TaxID=5037 RepID=F0UEY1_AJEC8|nr:predicted protein [Histoplasma capsulatum H143]EGC44046.1 predicted protein [Histoplasma capsulatum var. duboisii H88]